MLIKAIETEYAGILFRSKLEAMHAKFFDENKIEWHYEPHIIQSSVGDYLPDFYLPRIKTYFEVKGKGIPRKEKAITAIKELNESGDRKMLVVSNGEEFELYFYYSVNDHKWIYKKSELDEKNKILIDLYESDFNYYELGNAYPNSGKIGGCNNCGSVHFYDEDGTWICPRCGQTSEDAVFYLDKDYESAEIRLPSIRQDWKHK